MEQKIVVHMKGGVIHKGITQDFDPKNPSFHLLPAEGGGVPFRVQVGTMKALFWVKDYLGNREFVSRQQFGTSHATAKKAILTFEDGETLWGIVADGEDADSGLFVVPADERDNNLRIFVPRTSVKELRWVS